MTMAELRFTPERWRLAVDIWERLKKSITPTYTLAECLETAHLSGLREGREEAARVAEHLNGWGSEPNPELAAHIAKIIRALPDPPAGETT